MILSFINLPRWLVVGAPFVAAATLSAPASADDAPPADEPLAPSSTPAPVTDVVSAPADVPAEPSTSPSTDLGTGRRIPIGAYGEAHVVHEGDSTVARLRRFVLFVGHRFDDTWRLYSEIEIEDGHEIELEQAYVEAGLHEHLGLRVGLVLVPLGIINLLHEPPTFNGVDRPAVDQVILPSTWRELGAGVYGKIVDGLRYQAYVVSGLRADRFSAERGIAPGRGQGGDVSVKDGAVTGRLAMDALLGVELGAGFYAGGAGQDAPSLGGVKVGIVEADARYLRHGLSLRAEYARVFVGGAERITALARATNPSAPAVASAEQGFYGEVGYDVLSLLRGVAHQLSPFARYELVDTRSSLRNVLGAAHADAEQFLTFGLTYRPLQQIAFKVDYRRALAAQPDTAADRLSGGIAFMF